MELFMHVCYCVHFLVTGMYFRQDNQEGDHQENQPHTETVPGRTRPENRYVLL